MHARQLRSSARSAHTQCAVQKTAPRSIQPSRDADGFHQRAANWPAHFPWMRAMHFPTTIPNEMPQTAGFVSTRSGLHSLKGSNFPPILFPSRLTKDGV